MTGLNSTETIFFAVCSILAVLLLFAGYWYSVKKSLLFRLQGRTGFVQVSEMSMLFASEKVTGIIMTGVIPFVIFVTVAGIDPAGLGLTWGRTFNYWYFPFFLPLLTIVLSFISSRNPKLWLKSPQLRVKKWYPRHIVLSAGLWILYIFGYEYFFRGILWFLCLGAFGFWPALIINIILYSAVHVPQGIFMTAGAVPLGVVFCCMSFLTGSFLTAFLVHASMAVTTELSAAFHNPEFRFEITDKKSIR
ncbi:MAG: CPBP family intramembrane metalloprotease [Bacteroidales bacterium]|nr:CPBP family intramembrane metalloprotease [Bacteroidales bacterium]